MFRQMTLSDFISKLSFDLLDYNYLIDPKHICRMKTRFTRISFKQLSIDEVTDPLNNHEDKQTSAFQKKFHDWQYSFCIKETTADWVSEHKKYQDYFKTLDPSKDEKQIIAVSGHLSGIKQYLNERNIQIDESN